MTGSGLRRAPSFTFASARVAVPSSLTNPEIRMATPARTITRTFAAAACVAAALAALAFTPYRAALPATTARSTAGSVWFTLS